MSNKPEEEEKEENEENDEEESEEEKENTNSKISKDKKSSGNSKSQKSDNKYNTENIMEMAGLKIEKSSKNKNNSEKSSENEEKNSKNKESIIDKIIPDNPEIRNLQIKAAKLKNDFPKWKQITEGKGGEYAVKCWNCGNINICSSTFSVIQCPICHEMNKVPKPMDRIDQLLQLAKANTCISYADINHTVPLVNYVVVCPYCKQDNKIRETANFCICYFCKNRWSIKKPDDDYVTKIKSRNQPKNKKDEGNYYKYDDEKGVLIPPKKTLRFSDLFYPDPMFYPGYYPINSLSPLYPEYFTPYDDYRYIDRQEKTIKYFDRVNQQRKLMEEYGDIINDAIITNNNEKNNLYKSNTISSKYFDLNDNKKNENPYDKKSATPATKYEKPYYHLNFNEDLQKKNILEQLKELDKKSENLMKSRYMPKALTEKSSQYSNKSKYGGEENDSRYHGREDMTMSSMSKSINGNKFNRSQFSNNEMSENKTIKNKEESVSMNSKVLDDGISSKNRSIQNSFFMKDYE